MLKALFAVFIMLHGLVHLWYVTLSLRLVEFQPDMGWTGRSWLFSPLLGDAATRALAAVLYSLATLGFVAGGIGIFAGQGWWRPLVIGSATFSSAIILLFWDGNAQLLVQKGLIGLLINAGLLVALRLILTAPWPLR
jgi:hypothetical protein